MEYYYEIVSNKKAKVSDIIQQKFQLRNIIWRQLPIKYIIYQIWGDKQ